MVAEYYYFIASLIALILLIVSFLSLRKIHKQIVVANLREYCKSYRELLHKLPIEMLQDNLPEKFEYNEKDLLIVCSYFGILFEEFRLHEDGYIDRKSWQDWERNLEKHAGRHGFIKAWNNAKNYFDFNNAFALFLDKKIEKATSDNKYETA